MSKSLDGLFFNEGGESVIEVTYDVEEESWTFTESVIHRPDGIAHVFVAGEQLTEGQVEWLRRKMQEIYGTNEIRVIYDG